MIMKRDNDYLFFDKENAYDNAEKNEKLSGVENYERNFKMFTEHMRRQGVMITVRR